MDDEKRPDSVDDDDDHGPPDEDEVLARALHRKRYGGTGSTHYYVDWRGLYNGIRASPDLRREAEMALAAETARCPTCGK